MKHIHRLLLVGAAFLTAGNNVFAADQLAFPGAQGWGRYAKGARGSASPSVYHVTNLNDAGAGSLRDAVSAPNRIVVFDVSGVIRISSRIVFASNLYVAGQTAPGEGITVYGDGVSFSGASNIICRYLRVRMGHGGTSGKDCAGVASGQNMIFDHCSFSWGLDETFSINPDGKGAIGNITLQNSIIGQGLMSHSAGGLIQADHITLYRNLYCDNSTRNNKVKGINQYANNIVYNWKNGAYIMGGDSEGESFCNIQSNLFINGPAVGGAAFTGANEKFHCYGNDNWQDSNADGKLDPREVTDYSASDRLSSPYDYPTLDLWPGRELVEKLLPEVGASLPYRDQADCYMVDEVLSYGTSGELITYETSLPIGDPTTWTWWQGSKPKDSDGDGMPDWWESDNGTDPNKKDATTMADNGYLNIENYINSITAVDRQFYLRAPITLSAKSITSKSMTIVWRDYTYDESGFAIEAKTKDETEWQKLAVVEAGQTQYTMTNLQEGTTYDVRVRAIRGSSDTGKPNVGVPQVEVYSEYATGTFTTRPVEVGVIDVDRYQPTFTWTPELTVWDHVSTAWKEGKSWLDYGRVLFESDQDATVTLDEEVIPESMVVIGDGRMTFEGKGSISGDLTSVNKGGEGTLVLATNNSYLGATVLHEGTIEFGSLADGGVNSSLGAASAFAQNWIMDGGTYRYTGASTSSNRSARLLRPTVLEIANEGAVISTKGTFEGSGDLIIGGKGTLSISDTTFFGYTGVTELRGGTMRLSTVDAAKSLGGKKNRNVRLAGGKISFYGRSEDYQTYQFPVEAAESTYSYYELPTHCYVYNPFTGSGTIEFQIPYLRSYFRSSFADFKGRIVANGVGKDANGSLLLFYNSNVKMPNTVVTLRGNARCCIWDTNGNGELGGLAGEEGTYLMGSSKKTTSAICNWTIGSANTNETFKGVINNWSCSGKSYAIKSVNITKKGSGYWRLTGTNTYTGTTDVSAGTLIVNGRNNGTGMTTVRDGATLKGEGQLAGAVNVLAGGYIVAGDSVIGGKSLTVSGSVNISSGASLSVPLLLSADGKSIGNTFKMSGALTLREGAILHLDLDYIAEDIADNTALTVFSTLPSISGTFTTINPAIPAEGQKWDLSELYTKGIVYVRNANYEDTSAIEQIGQDDTSDVTYLLNGQKATTLQKGMSVIRNGKIFIYE